MATIEELQKMVCFFQSSRIVPLTTGPGTMGISHKAVKGLGNQSNRVLGDIQNINRDKENTIKKIVPQKWHSLNENESDF